MHSAMDEITGESLDLNLRRASGALSASREHLHERLDRARSTGPTALVDEVSALHTRLGEVVEMLTGVQRTMNECLAAYSGVDLGEPELAGYAEVYNARVYERLVEVEAELSVVLSSRIPRVEEHHPTPASLYMVNLRNLVNWTLREVNALLELGRVEPTTDH